jgi:hypothetical protein
MKWLVFGSAHLFAMLGEIISFVSYSYLQQHIIKILAAFHLYFQQLAVHIYNHNRTIYSIKDRTPSVELVR